MEAGTRSDIVSYIIVKEVDALITTTCCRPGGPRPAAGCLPEELSEIFEAASGKRQASSDKLDRFWNIGY